ncbi:MAG: nucleotidyltransferase family protein [Acidobacteria bacterium]|nr:nucleotidyltransferase family protein [Acidobacteriota bacterium]
MTPGGDEGWNPSEPAARWLTRALVQGFSPSDKSRITSILAEASDHTGIASVVGATAVKQPDDLAGEVIGAAQALAEATTASNSSVLERWREVGEAFEDQRLRWAALHGLSHLGTLYPDPEDRLVRTLHVLVHRYDAPRARVLLATRGLAATGGARGPWLYRGAGISVCVHDRLQPPAFPEVPLSPFLEGGQLDETAMVKRMAGVATFAAHRLLATQKLWQTALADPLHIAEAAVLAQRAGAEAAEMWAERCRRWGVGKLWRRAAEVDHWLLGDARPEWLAAGYGSFPVADVAQGVSLRQGLVLQDGPAGMVGYLFRRLVLRQA